MTLGQVAYEAFKEADDQRHPGDDPLADWEWLNTETRVKWQLAAVAAVAASTDTK